MSFTKRSPSEERTGHDVLICSQLWKTLQLPIDNPSKPESQSILHAIEELYFFRRYEEALKIIGDALKGELIEEFRKSLEDYKIRCQAKVDKNSATALKLKEGGP